MNIRAGVGVCLCVYILYRTIDRTKCVYVCMREWVYLHKSMYSILLYALYIKEYPHKSMCSLKFTRVQYFFRFKGGNQVQGGKSSPLPPERAHMDACAVACGSVLCL